MRGVAIFCVLSFAASVCAGDKVLTTRDVMEKMCLELREARNWRETCNEMRQMLLDFKPHDTVSVDKLTWMWMNEALAAWRIEKATPIDERHRKRFRIFIWLAVTPDYYTIVRGGRIVQEQRCGLPRAWEWYVDSLKLDNIVE